MKLSEKAERYAKAHPQTVSLSWIDSTTREYPADKAVRLCSVPRIAACIMGVAVCEDKTLAEMLNQLLGID